VQVIFRKKATNCRALLRKMTYTDKASYDSTPLCTCKEDGNQREWLLPPNLTTKRVYFVAVHCVVLHCVAARGRALQCVAVRCSALQCVAVRCSALQCVAVRWSVWQCVAVRGSALQCVAVHCNASQCAALQRVRMRLQRLGASDLSFVFQSFTPTNKRLTSEGPSRAKTQKRNQKDLFLLCHIKVGL